MVPQPQATRTSKSAPPHLPGHRGKARSWRIKEISWEVFLFPEEALGGGQKMEGLDLAGWPLSRRVTRNFTPLAKSWCVQ